MSTGFTCSVDVPVQLLSLIFGLSSTLLYVVYICGDMYVLVRYLLGREGATPQADLPSYLMPM